MLIHVSYIILCYICNRIATNLDDVIHSRCSHIFTLSPLRTPLAENKFIYHFQCWMFQTCPVLMTRLQSFIRLSRSSRATRVCGFLNRLSCKLHPFVSFQLVLVSTEPALGGLVLFSGVSQINTSFQHHLRDSFPANIFPMVASQPNVFQWSQSLPIMILQLF